MNPRVKIVTITPDAQKLIANARWFCKGNEKENPTQKQISQSIANAFKVGHMSVFEHACVTFEIHCTRVTSHQIVRQRTASFSQRSQRAIPQASVPVFIPELADGKLLGLRDQLDALDTMYQLLVEMGTPIEDARYILPTGKMTALMMTLDFRNLLHFLRLRLDGHAQWEIRGLAQEMLRLMEIECPDIFNIDRIKNLKYVPDWSE